MLKKFKNENKKEIIFLKVKRKKKIKFKSSKFFNS